MDAKAEVLAILQIRHQYYEITHVSKILRDEAISFDFSVVSKSSVKYNHLLILQNDLSAPCWKICSKQMLYDNKVALWKKDQDWTKYAKLKYSQARQEIFQIKIIATQEIFKVVFEDKFSSMMILSPSGDTLCRLKTFNGAIGSSGGLLFIYLPDWKDLSLIITVLILYIQETTTYLVTNRPHTIRHVKEILQNNVNNRRSTQTKRKLLVRRNTEDKKAISHHETSELVTTESKSILQSEKDTSHEISEQPIIMKVNPPSRKKKKNMRSKSIAIKTESQSSDITNDYSSSRSRTNSKKRKNSTYSSSEILSTSPQEIIRKSMNSDFSSTITEEKKIQRNLSDNSLNQHKTKQEKPTRTSRGSVEFTKEIIQQSLSEDIILAPLPKKQSSSASTSPNVPLNARKSPVKQKRKSTQRQSTTESPSGTTKRSRMKSNAAVKKATPKNRRPQKVPVD